MFLVQLMHLTFGHDTCRLRVPSVDALHSTVMVNTSPSLAAKIALSGASFLDGH